MAVTVDLPLWSATEYADPGLTRRANMRLFNRPRGMVRLRLIASVVMEHCGDLPESAWSLFLEEVDYIEQFLIETGLITDQACGYAALVRIIHDNVHEQSRRDEDRRLRALFRRRGLHAMHATARVAPSPSTEPATDVCAVCYDAEKQVNVSGQCRHPPELCPRCARRLDRCPVCRQPGPP